MVSTLIKNILFSIITALGCITDTCLIVYCHSAISQHNTVIPIGELNWTIHEKKMCFSVTKKNGSALNEGHYITRLSDLLDNTEGELIFYINKKGELNKKLNMVYDKNSQSIHQISNGCYNGTSKIFHDGNLSNKTIFKKGLEQYAEEYSPSQQLLAKSIWKYKRNKIFIETKLSDSTTVIQIKERKTNQSTLKEYNKNGDLILTQIYNIKDTSNERIVTTLQYDTRDVLTYKKVETQKKIRVY
ncbi:hypothetical protein [uncultured Tenacibaculum sp.]|uniref:hypothetical protein n=1 Tax=uncultured Tenacibaculum sp. TaxID=174713 RepID=UPI002637A978|nr:hypothetical protein [uncultured Tenacibaculum sp.]